jgi:hypothetical protein
VERDGLLYDPALYRMEPWPDQHERMKLWIRGESSPVFQGLDEGAARACQRILIGMCLHLSNRPEEEGDSGRPRGQKKKRRDQGGGVVTVGREIKVSREIRELAKVSATEEEYTRWKVRARFLVRGHYRNQAVGPNHSERRRRWIEPYWKGPTDGPQLDRLYAIEADGSESSGGQK